MAAVLHHSRAKGTAKLILLGIANHAGDGGAWPYVETLARYANVDERTAQRAIRELVKLGELHVDRQAGGFAKMRNDARPNRYDVLVRCPQLCDGTSNHRIRDYPQPTLVVDNGVTLTSPRNERGDTDVTPRGDTDVTHNRPINPERIAVSETVTTGARAFPSRELCGICGYSRLECARRQPVSGHAFEAIARRKA